MISTARVLLVAGVFVPSQSTVCDGCLEASIVGELEQKMIQRCPKEVFHSS